jgi:hypothetical protein
MKKSTLILSLTLVTAVPAKEQIEENYYEPSPATDIQADTVYTYEYEILYTGIFGTTNHAVPEQTDNTPLITADGSLIDTTRVNDLRWVALSRDLLNLKTSRYNFTGKIKLGDTIFIDSPDPRIRGLWIVKDSMGDYFWQEQDIAPDSVTSEMFFSKNYKIEKGKVFKKHPQRKWIDFLQDPKTGFLAAWKKRDIVIKKRSIQSYTVVPRKKPSVISV